MLTKLKSLDLSHNPLEDLQPDAFKDVTVSVLMNLFDVSEINFFSFKEPQSTEMPRVPITEHQPATL